MTDEKEELYIQVGTRVREAREAAKMTQEELAQRIGLTRASVTNIETARQKIQLQALYYIANALQVDVSTLLPSANVIQRGTSPRLQQVLKRTKNVRPTEKAILEELLSGVTPARRKSRTTSRTQGREKSP